MLVTVETICVSKVIFQCYSHSHSPTVPCHLFKYPLSTSYLFLPFLSPFLSLLLISFSCPSLLSLFFTFPQAIGPGYYISLICSSQRSKSKFRRLLTGLIHNSGDVNTTGENGMTALHFAVLVSKISD